MIRHFFLLACAVLFFSGHVHGHTLTLANDSQSFATLSGTTVTMTGRSELRITGNTAPITGCVIHLNSPDSWFFMTTVRPATVSSSYLSQVRVNGAAAVLNTNCRVVEYGDGTVVIPHASTFAPLQVFSGSYFTGSSMQLTNYTAYNDSSLGVLANNVSSFKLKRGYTATLAQNASGTGMSRNYVAQDGDIEVAVMPSGMNDSVSFIRIFPWRWVTKKGSCDVDPTALNATWHYNWNIDKNSALNWEYVAIKQQPHWPSLAQDWKARGVNHVLGLNEPNNPVEDSYKNLTPVGSVDDAVARMPDLLGTGLRVGAPAVTDGGYSWIVDFVNKANTAGHRIDFVPVHYYRSSSGNNPTTAANSMYAFLKSIHDATGKPIWVTEFNNGANWTDNAHDPNTDQNKNVIEAMMNMMDSTPWIERYAVYSNVEWFRKTNYDDGSLTPMGVMYRDRAAPIAYLQEIPVVSTSSGAFHSFENNAQDGSAYGNSAILKGQANFDAGHTGQALELSGAAANNDHVLLSDRLGDSTDFSFGAWVYPTSGSQWQRIFDLGSGTETYMFLSPISGSGNLRFAMRSNGGSEQQLNHTVPLPLNTWTHVAVTISGNTGKLFVNGALVNTNTAMTINPVDLGTNANYLGKSQFAADPLFAGKLDDVAFYPHALTDAQVAAMPANTPPEFTNPTINGGAATQSVAYTGNIAGSATDADAGEALVYTKISGPAWLNVATNGALSGTPTMNDAGAEEFVLHVTDRAGANDVAVLTITLPVIIGNGTWATDADGTWSDATKWTGAFPANGETYSANFSTLNITADRTVMLDTSRSIGSLVFGDTSGAQNWTLLSSEGKDLRLATTPVITVVQNTATISASLAGTAGFTKTGTGTLVLNGDNSLAGTLNIDTSSTTVNEGVVRLANPNAASSLTGIQIRNNNSGASTLELDGTSGDVTTLPAAALSLSGRGNIIPAIRNLAGDNTLGGTITLQSGGGTYTFQSDAGVLNLAAITSNAPASARALTFQGAGNFSIGGLISNGTTTAGIAVVKTGTGGLHLGGTNTFTGDLTIGGGIVTAGTGQGSTPAASNLGALQPAANRNITVNAGATLSLIGGNVLGTGGSTNTLANNTLVLNAGGLFLTGLDGPDTGWWNKIGSVNLNGGTMRIGSGANPTNFQGLALVGTVTAGGSTPSLIENLPSSNATANGIHLGQNATAGQSITFNVADVTAGPAADLTISAKLLNTSANLVASGLVKSGAGTLLLAGENAYTGPTTVSAGALYVGGGTTTSSTTVASSATLGGSGTVGGVTLQSGANLAPGVNGIGTLAANGNVVLQSGSATRMELNKITATADKLTVNGTLTLGGGLHVTNLGGTLAGGDSFTLFQANTIAGSFSSVSLPALATGLTWNTSALTSGVIRIDSDYSYWSASHPFGPGENGPASDPDADGMVNSIEWLLGADPLGPDSSLLPKSGIRTLTTAEYPAAAAGKTYLTLTARVRKSLPGHMLIPQANTDLEQLDTPASSGNVASFLVRDLGEFEERTWIFTQDVTGGRGFMRLKLVGQD
ncbi:autotransporter-associated beta strand repeat-containing protein [Luteolibacter yonseiensis]|uniref:Autotransporter-associated beta strand repeat-containing protein n=1 Tax=Luteolibacter yonseiensis TaxID=1144680 RepID=A0A934VDC4_9BACT|nr:LamG-like jellyroll fold domain-containing protein [Luteolibacter yonseiensis]MBK1817419.1 autotransporter-associated beta strand repeat-containing protein [Luteolibacter yonseiensis]